MRKSSAAFWASAIALSLGMLLLIGTTTGYLIRQDLGGIGWPNIPDGLTLTCSIGNCSKCASQTACEGAGCRWVPAGSSGGIGWTAYCAEPVQQPEPIIAKEKGKANATVAMITGKRVLSLDFGRVEGLSFRKMSLDMKDVNPTNVMISVEKLPGRPEDVTTPLANAYEYVKVSTTGITSDDVNSITIMFAVSRDWIAGNDIDKAAIRMSRWNIDTLSWDELTTTTASEDAAEIVFSAVSPGFSYFLITGSEAAPAPTENITEPTENATEPAVEQPSARETAKLDAEEAISHLRSAIEAAGLQGKDVREAEGLLADAQNAYDLGDYETALAKAEAGQQSLSGAAVISKPETRGDMTAIILLMLAILFIACGAIGLFILKSKKTTVQMPALGGEQV
ncbi:MAG: PGF-pre-PGF domain-containing protein [Candidatus Aenigmatarchaeota archaeon]